MTDQDGHPTGWRRKLYVIIFGVDTPAGKAFDVFLLWAIGLSVLAVMLESVSFIKEEYDLALDGVEWFFTIVFTLEYIARIISVKKPLKYIFSFFGIIDLLSILPTYFSIFVPGSEYVAVIRISRLIRVFRVLKLVRFSGEAGILMQALKASRAKITVFLMAVLIIVMIMGTLMYVIEEKSDSGFTSIPRSIYWAIVTLTTVGYGDISPVTAWGQFIASVLMLLGYAIIAVPTGIVSIEMNNAAKNMEQPEPVICPNCQEKDHLPNATYCHNCGSRLG